MRRALLLTLSLLALGLPAAALAGFDPIPGNPADRLTAVAIDDYAYDRATGCRKTPQSGTLAFQAWLGRNARGTSWGIMRCSKLGPGNWSLHAEGRALDWHLNAHRATDRREAARIIALLLATDRAGNPHALARRMGVQEIIFNCRAWWSGGDELVPYSACYGREGQPRRVGDTIAHRDHIHFGLSKQGAQRRTSFWSAGR